MLPFSSSPLALRALRSRALPTTVRFSTSTLRASEQAEAPQPAPRKLTYFIHRTATGNLPVYLGSKRGGSLQQTQIRKIEGDAKALKEDLVRTLGISPEEIKINGLTNQVWVKGYRRDEVTTMLKDLGF